MLLWKSFGAQKWCVVHFHFLRCTVTESNEKQGWVSNRFKKKEEENTTLSVFKALTEQWRILRPPQQWIKVFVTIYLLLHLLLSSPHLLPWCGQLSSELVQLLYDHLNIQFMLRGLQSGCVKWECPDEVSNSERRDVLSAQCCGSLHLYWSVTPTVEQSEHLFMLYELLDILKAVISVTKWLFAGILWVNLG